MKNLKGSYQRMRELKEKKNLHLLTDISQENLAKEVAHAQTFSYSIEDKTREKAENIEEDNLIKCYLAYLETPAAYYSCLISAPTPHYDKYIHIWSTITSTLNEDTTKAKN